MNKSPSDDGQYRPKLDFIAKTVPRILILGGIVMLLFSLTPLGAPAVWGWALIIIGVLLYLLEFVPGLRGGV